MLDSTLGCSGEDCPGTLTTAEVDQIVNDFLCHVPLESLLLIGNHYPVETHPDMSWSHEEPHWHERHFWNNAIALRQRLRGLNRRAPTIWMSGDIHVSDHLAYQHQHFIVTGRLGARITGAYSVPRQAKVIQFRDDGYPTVITLSLREDLLRPTWETRTSPIRVLEERPAGSRGHTVSGAAPLAAAAGSATSTATVVPALELLSQLLQEKLIKEIRDRQLYTLGRFETWDEDVSLSWVSIGPLLNVAGVLPLVVDCMHQWLRTKLTWTSDGNPQSAVLLGEGCWGASLAAQLSILTGIKNVSLAARGRGRYYTDLERLNSENVEIIRAVKEVVIVSDVVATGRTISFLRDEILKLAAAAKVSIERWLSLSVLCHKRAALLDSCKFLTARGTTCSDLPLLVVPKDNLPDEQILPPIISFI